ncbi:MAG: tRNA (adenosine(37)-N6)-threonylcarbamoyltransferase complex ATPase subunit type 1 TsaE [Patescibacteria group bacterium]
MEIEFLETDLPKVAKKLKGQFKAGDIVGFSGQLAAGKTTLISQIVLAYGYTGRVSSPTFVIEHRYPLSDNQKINEIIHLDLYRLNQEDLGSIADKERPLSSFHAAIDWAEYRHQKRMLVFVEWPERLNAGLLPINKQVNIEIINEKKRKLTLSNNPTN